MAVKNGKSKGKAGKRKVSKRKVSKKSVTRKKRKSSTGNKKGPSRNIVNTGGLPK